MEKNKGCKKNFTRTVIKQHSECKKEMQVLVDAFKVLPQEISEAIKVRKQEPQV